MTDTDNLLQNNRRYSLRCEELARLLADQPAMRARQLDLHAGDVDPYMRGYPYPTAAWPVIISKDTVAEFTRFITALPALCLKAIHTMFGSDAAAFAGYLQESPLVHELVMQYGFNHALMLNRHDMVFSGGALKLIEVNAGSTIGGWQPGLLEPQYRQVLGEFGATASWSLQHRDVLGRTFAALRSAIRHTKPYRAVGNVLAYNGGDAAAATMLERHYRAVFHGPGDEALPHGKIFFESDWTKIEFRPDGVVRVEGHEIDAVMICTPDGQAIPVTAFMRLMGSAVAGQIVMPDSQHLCLLGNKLLMALLHEPAMAPHWSAEERDMVARHIPFTVTMEDQPRQWAGNSWALRDLLVEHRARFVIKKAHSRMGRDVYIGKSCEPAQWRAIVDAHVGQPDWLAQEFCHADPVLAPDMAGAMAEHSCIWGIFDLGGQYGGAFVRGMPHGKGNGVINSATGAVEFAVFEETAKKNRTSF